MKMKSNAQKTFFFKEKCLPDNTNFIWKTFCFFFFIMKYLIICDSGVRIYARAHVLSHYIAAVNVAEEWGANEE